MSAELEYIWSRVQAELELAVGEPTYRIWLAQLRARELVDGRLLIEVPVNAQSWIRERFGGVLRSSAASAIGPGARVELIGAADEHDRQASVASPPSQIGSADGRRAGRRWVEGRGPRERPGAAIASADSPSERRAERSIGSEGSAIGNPKLTFEQFVIGECNRLAHAAALAVAEMPAHAYNPLYICGPPGVGKTHLLSAIATLLEAHSPDLIIRSSTGEAFTNEFLDALAGGRTDHFKARFRHVDVLLVDDIQFLERKVRTEEEFFHTFNALHDGGRQIVLSSDRPPADLQALEDRLRERFQAGLVAEIKPPGLGTRMAILRKRVQHDRVQLTDERVLDVIAARIDTNVRALEGALIRVVAFGSLTGRPLTVELAVEVLATLYPGPSRTPSSRQCSVADIQGAICERFGVSQQELASPSRARRIAWPRQLAMYLAREFTPESLPAIGRAFGGRDHTTVLHAWRRTSAKLLADDRARTNVSELCAALELDQRSASRPSPDRAD